MNGRRVFRRYFFHDLTNERGEKVTKSLIVETQAYKSFRIFVEK